MAALPIAMLGATLLGIGAGIASVMTSETERDSIQLKSGQHVRIQSRVRLSTDGKKNHPDSCLVASEDGTVTKVDVVGRKATVRCNKNRRAAPEEIPAEDLEVIDSGINAPGISIAGGYVTEGASVRMLDSSKRTNRGKALASPFYNPVGTVLAIDKVAKQLVVLSNHLNNKSTAQEFYNIDDLEFVSGPSEAARTGAQAGLALKIGSTVELTEDAKKKYAPSIVASNLGSNSDNKKLADPKWEKFGIVKSITVDPKDIKKKIVIVRCVSKDSRKEVIEQKYDFPDLKAIPAISVERAGIAVFGGMAEMDTKVKLRSERKLAVASKSLGRSAFGDVGTVTDLEPNDPNNLKIFVTCNGIKPDEQTGDWYQPEDLEIAEPADTEGEAVFGGRVVVGSMVRVTQSARGKKCLGTPEFGDVGTVKGIDPSASENLKINVSCGRSDAKQSEWYDPRDLSLYFPTDESGSELEKAKVALAAAQKELSAWQLRPQEERRSEDGRRDKKALEDKVAAAQAEVDKLSGQGLDKTKASEMRNDSEEKLDEAVKLKRELEAVRLKLSRDSTCKDKPERSKKYATASDEILVEWLQNMFIGNIDYKSFGTEPLQYSNSHRVAFAELKNAYQSLNINPVVDDTYTKYKALNAAKLALREDLKNERSDTESFSNLDDMLLDVAKKQKAFDDTGSSPYKTALKTIDEKLKKLQEVATQIQSAAYSGDSPAEKLLKRVEDLEKKTNKDIADNATNLGDAVTNYNAKFLAEQRARTKLDTDKYVYDQEVLGKKKPNPPAAITDDTIKAKLDTLETSRLTYLNAQKETLKARKEQALLSAKTTCSEITLESVNDMKSKIEKIISGKCEVVKTVDELLDQVDTLISNRKRAFTMSQAVLDPKFGDPNNATFDTPIASPEDRITEIEAAMTAIKSSELSDGDLWKKLQTLIGLCGTYPGDTTLDDAKAIEQYPPPPPNNCPPNPGNAPAAPEGAKPKKPSRLNADAPEFVPPAAPGTPPMTPPGTPEESEEDEPPPPPPAPPAPPRVVGNPMRSFPPARPTQPSTAKQHLQAAAQGLREMSGSAPPAPPAVLNSRTNIEEWVTNEVTTKNYKQSGSSTRGQPNSDLVSSSYRVKIPPGWRTIKTIGDGSCLIHSYLQALSPTYNTLSEEDKRKLASSFRTYFQNKKPTNARGDIYTRKNSTEWLTDREITDLSKEFNVITVIFDQQAKELQVSYGNYILLRGIPDGATVVFIHSDGSVHYQTVIDPAGNTTQPYSTAIQTFTDNLIDIETRLYGGKRKWPFYGRRTTRRNQRGGVEQSDVVKAKADYDAATKNLENYIAALNVAKANLQSLGSAGNIDRNDPNYKKLVDQIREVEDNLAIGRGKKTSAFITYDELRRKLAEEQEQSRANDPFASAPPNIRATPEEMNAAIRKENLQAELNSEEAAEAKAKTNAYSKARSQAAAAATAEEKAEAAADAKAKSEAAAAARAEYLRQIDGNLRKWIKFKFGTLTAQEQADKFEEYKSNLEKNTEYWKEFNATITAGLEAAYNKLKAAAKAASSAGQTVKVTAANIGKYLNPAPGIASLKSKFNEWANKRAGEQADKEQKQKEKDEATANIIRERAKAKGKSDEEAEALVQEFLSKTAFKRKEAKDAQRAKDAEEASNKREEREANAKKAAAAKSKAAAEAAVDKKFKKDTIAYNSLKAKWDEYEGRYKIWKAKRDLFDKCYAEYVAAKQQWSQKRKIWSDNLIKVSEALSSYQILRLQSRGVGSSLMLDEARKLMIDADAQQRTVMDSKTDLQFTLASSSDADIAKAVGFYEAEVQKLKTCISKGKEDAIAEYDKDLAEIEKRKKEITTKTFEVKAPQENQQQGTPKYNEWDTARLTTEVARLESVLAAQKAAPPGSKQNKKQAGTNTQLQAARKALATKLAAPAPTPGGRRFTRRRRV